MSSADTPSPTVSPPCPIGCAGEPELHCNLAGYPVYRCPTCGLFFLGQRPGTAAFELERDAFEGAFQSLRIENYDTILGELGELGAKPGDPMLDVGCSSGWFLNRARDAGYDCKGIEPDPFFFSRARASVLPGVEIINGHFDGDLPQSWQNFRVITFHDVFEHVPNPPAILAACRDRLQPDGLLVLSLPSADGFVFKLSDWLSRIGITAPLERMFQVHYPYPHLFYFNDQSLTVMAQRFGFTITKRRWLRSFRLRGALSRAQMDRAHGLIGWTRNLVAAAALALFAGLQYAMPADNTVFILRRNRS